MVFLFGSSCALVIAGSLFKLLQYGAVFTIFPSALRTSSYHGCFFSSLYGSTAELFEKTLLLRTTKYSRYGSFKRKSDSLNAFSSHSSETFSFSISVTIFLNREKSLLILVRRASSSTDKNVVIVPESLSKSSVSLPRVR